MLHGMTCALPPSARMPFATSSQASALRLEITTLAPSFASNSAEARPMPRLEPVMMGSRAGPVGGAGAGDEGDLAGEVEGVGGHRCFLHVIARSEATKQSRIAHDAL